MTEALLDQLRSRMAAADDPSPGDSGPAIAVDTADGVAVVVISNVGARNAMTLAMWAAIEQTFSELATDRSLRLVVVRGAGTTAFAAGADIGEFPENRLDSARAAAYNDQLSRALRAVAAIQVPTVAMIRGFAVGGGCELSAACDLRIGADDVSIGIPIGRLGVILGVTESRLLVRHIGVSGLKRVLFSGELFDAAASLDLGLLDEVHPAQQLPDRVAELATTVRASSAVTMRAAKVITDLAGSLDDTAAETVTQLMAAAYDGPDLREGVSAFLEKRRPNFGKD